jgi:ribosomal protein S18 acetylase RimI-like enzyme
MDINLKIRNATKLDLSEILEIIDDARELFTKLKSKQWLASDRYPNQETFLNDIKLNQLFVATLTNKVIGLVVISKLVEPTYLNIYEGQWLTNNQPYLVIHRLAIKKQYYGAGVSKSLLMHAEKIAKENKIKSIKLDTAKENQPMQRLVDKLGYKYCGIIKLNKYQGLEDIRLAFEKII